ncbi:hypothetical protein [Micromonospora sp. DT47]|uniref:hypothetical protein n=1 Tax=Micromonospora sp. DT47 TaxID=3393431 RepID=UPI003CF11D48
MRSRGWHRPKALPGAPAQGRTELAALRGASLATHQLGHPYAGTKHLLVDLLAGFTAPQPLHDGSPRRRSSLARRARGAGRDRRVA